MATKYDIYSETDDHTAYVIRTMTKLARDIAQFKGFDYFETSSKTGLNINEVFNTIATKIKERKDQEKEERETDEYLKNI